MKNILMFAMLWLVLWFSACTDSDSYYYDEEDTQYIQVNAYLTNSFEETAIRVKCDSIAPGDSLIFISSVQPSKSVRSKQTYWTLDGKPFAQEFSFKSTVVKPGIHKIAFNLVDYFGDTTSDTITLYVSTPPILDIKNFIPATGTQKINPSDQIQFAWNGYDPDSLWDMDYNFTLFESQPNDDGEYSIIVDTIIHQPYFTVNNKLESLSKYYWKVSAINELKQKSEQDIAGTFFTQGSNDESAILLSVNTTSSDPVSAVHVLLLNLVGDTIRNIDNLNLRSMAKSAYIRPLSPMRYQVVTYIDSLPDFIPDTTVVELSESQVSVLDTIYLKDTTAPSIESFDRSDSLTYADTLKFRLKDGGGKIAISKTSVSLDNASITDISLSSDTLTIILPHMESWSYRILNITSVDQSANTATKNFYLTPNAKLSEVIQ